MDRNRRLPGYYVCWNDYDHTNRQIRRSKQFGKQSDAREFCRQRNAKADLGAIGSVVPVPISQAGREFLGGLAVRSAETIRQYATTIGMFAAFAGDVNVCTVGRTEIDGFIADRMGKGSEATAAKHVRSLRRWFNWCVKEDYTDRNPIDLATALPRNNIVRKKPRISSGQFAKLIDCLDTDDRRLAVQIAATTGLDRNVIATMTAADVDLDNRQFVLERFKVKRLVYPYIHDDLMTSLTERVGRSTPGLPLLQGLSHQGGPTDWWKLAATASGMPGLKFVDLRTYAVNWLRAIVGDFDAQKIVGHSTPAVTAHHYYQANPDAQKLISGRPLPGTRARRGTAKT